jgi:hypothetical protein
MTSSCLIEITDTYCTIDCRESPKLSTAEKKEQYRTWLKEWYIELNTNTKLDDEGRSFLLRHIAGVKRELGYKHGNQER